MRPCLGKYNRDMLNNYTEKAEILGNYNLPIFNSILEALLSRYKTLLIILSFKHFYQDTKLC